jgi:hypothetical protein
VKPIDAVSLAMRRSQASARHAPAPAAGPFTAAMTGFDIRSMKETIRAPVRTSSAKRSRSRSAASCAITRMSPPVEKARPTPVMMTHRTESSASSSCSPASMSSRMVPAKALSRSGRLMRTQPMSPSRSTRMLSCFDATPLDLLM